LKNNLIQNFKKNTVKKNSKIKLLLLIAISIINQSFAQTEMDGLMMTKKLFCAGALYGHNSWKNYWEGTFKRENLNLGNVTTNTFLIDGNYGIKDNLNILFNAQYIKTKASAGQLAGQKGLQDVALFLKWVPFETEIKGGTFGIIGIAGGSIPMSNYTPDIQPLSIGVHCKTATARVMIDYQKNTWFGTASASYTYRGNVKLDRNSYYTTQENYSNTVQMPNASNFNLRAGYRDDNWVVEGVANQWNCLTGFDITKNNMPFISNKMDATTLGLHIKYTTKFIDGLEIIADGFTTVAGRNMGQTKGFTAGLFYIMNFAKKNKEKKEVKTQN
jgi:hypothetical protein